MTQVTAASADARQNPSRKSTAARERLTLIRLFEELRVLGYDGSYDAVRRYARLWSRQHAGQTAEAFVPLSFAPGEAYQFDRSHEVIVMGGITVTVKVAAFAARFIIWDQPPCPTKRSGRKCLPFFDCYSLTSWRAGEVQQLIGATHFG